MGRVLATADVGSNTVHLLIAEIMPKGMLRLANESEWIALGESVAREGCVSEAKLGELVTTLKRYRRMARARNAERFYVFATEAVRMASNRERAIDHIRAEADVTIDLISPRREAELSVHGCRLDSPPPDVLIEVGGGSAQLALVANYEVTDSVSAPLGTGRLIAETHLRAHPSGKAIQHAADYVAESLKGIHLLQPNTHPKVVACGGVVRGLWRAVHPDGHKTLHRKELEYVLWSASRLPASIISARFGVKGRRAGTLLTGALVYLGFMDHVGIDELQVSEYGVREGAVLDLVGGAFQPCLV